MGVITEEENCQKKKEDQDMEKAEEIVDGFGVLVPPKNFAVVEQGVYRSGFPEISDFSFIQTLNLKSIIYLCPEPYPEEHCKFLDSHNIKLYQFGIQGKKEAKRIMPGDIIAKALKVLIDSRNHPVLIHCNRGKHRTGSLVGCLRKLQYWRIESVLEEYVYYAGVKARTTDMEFMEGFDIESLRLITNYGKTPGKLMFQEVLLQNLEEKGLINPLGRQRRIPLKVQINAKGAVVVVISILIIENPVSMTGMLGLCLMVFEVILYSEAKKRSNLFTSF